jgi:acetamidase/formamidase
VTQHRLESTTETVIDVLSPEREPILTVAPGDTVVVHTLDASGSTRRPSPEEDLPSDMIQDIRGHCLVGPIATEGVEAGQMLAVRFVSLVPDEWGWTLAGARDTALNRHLGVGGDDTARLLWDLDRETKIATNQLGVSTAMRPFLGVVAMTPPEPGEHSTTPPRTVGAGNIDCRELVAGSTLCIPATVAGAHLWLGDGHAAQGDGEVSGTAIETGMTTELVLDVEPAPEVPGIHAITPAGRITFGFDADLNEAMAVALDAMLGWMQKLYSLTKPEALAVASTTVSMRVTQVVNETWGVHALLPHDAITSPQEA